MEVGGESAGELDSRESGVEVVGHGLVEVRFFPRNTPPLRGPHAAKGGDGALGDGRAGGAGSTSPDGTQAAHGGLRRLGEYTGRHPALRGPMDPRVRMGAHGALR